MVTHDDAVCRAAQDIVAVLPELVGHDAAPDLTRRLESALHGRGDDMVIQVGELLRQHPATRAWMRDRLAEDASARGDTVRSFQTLPGHTPAPAGDRFECPVCGSPWFRPAVGESVPACPEHHVARVRVTP